MASFYTILTSVGQAKVANAVALGQKVNLSTLAVGDANGVTPQPDANAKALVHERLRAPLNRVEVDKDNPNFIVCEQVLPPEVGGWEIREIGVFDDEGNLIAYGNYPPTYKPLLNEGTSRTQTVRMVMQVSDTAAVTLKVDPSIVLATREYVDESNRKVGQQVSELDGALSTLAKSGKLEDAIGILAKEHGGTGRGDGDIDARFFRLSGSDINQGYVISSINGIPTTKITLGEDDGSDLDKTGNMTFDTFNGVAIRCTADNKVSWKCDAKTGSTRQRGDIIFDKGDGHIKYLHNMSGSIGIKSGSGTNLVIDDAFCIQEKDGATSLKFENGVMTCGTIPLAHVAASDGDTATTEKGYINLAGGLILQWASGPLSREERSEEVVFEKPFPNECLSASVTTKLESGSASTDGWFQLVSWSKTSAIVMRQSAINNPRDKLTQAIVWAIGR